MCTPKPRKIPFGSWFQTTIIECHGAFEPPPCPSFSGPRPNKCSTWLWSDSMSATEHWSSEILSLGKVIDIRGRSLPQLCECLFSWVQDFHLTWEIYIDFVDTTYLSQCVSYITPDERKTLATDSAPFTSLHQETTGSSSRSSLSLNRIDSTSACT